MMNYSGRWEGVLTYGDTYPKAGAKLKFQLDIHETGGVFYGVSVDLEGDGMNPYGASVVGGIKGNLIHFVKHYKYSHHATEEGETVIRTDLAGMPIQYTGHYLEKMERFEGEWKYEFSQRYFLFFMRKVSYGNGTWYMKRVGEWTD